MNKTPKSIRMLALLVVIFSLALGGCVETEYYHRYHHHSRGWYDHRHEPYPPNVDVDIDVH